MSGHSLGIRPFYTLRQIARALRIDRRTALKLFEAHDVTVVRVGSRIWVPLEEVETKLENLWKSLLLAERVRKSFKARSF
jgi:hypothetical protein